MVNNNKKHLLFVGAIISIVLIIGGLIYQQEIILQEGSTTILETRPVDPRDLFRGEYVILRYAIESDVRIQEEAAKLELGDTLFIKLVEDENGVAYVGEVSDQSPDSLEGLWIAGEVNGRRVRFPSLEQFYVPEGAGLSVENFGSDLHVEVVLKGGEARVTGLLDASLNKIDPESFLE
jgi:uncharacterized membrane-anchored protein